MSERVPKKKTTWSWRSRAARGIVYQVVALLLVGGFVWFLAHNTQENMRVRGIQSGFDFLGQAAGFDIGETLIAYDPSQSYGRALWVGVLNTLRVAVIGIVLTTILGVLVGVGRFSRNALVRGLCYGYVELFRGTPVLLQLYVLYYGLAPLVALDACTAAVLGLGLNYAAYESELYRAGLEAVPRGQTEAALALGMSRAQALRDVVLPQALRVALPGMANDFIALLKDSSLVSVITVVELTKQMTITAVDVRGWLVPGLVCAALYLALSWPLGRLARRLERRLVPAPA